MICPTCGNPHSNPKFCSRSCSASWSNKQTPKRKKKNFKKNCLSCGKTIGHRSVKCFSCFQIPEDMTLESAIYTKHHRSSAYGLVRVRARAYSKKLGFDSCIKCGYDKHVEVAHIKPISSFPLSAMISEINHKDNLMALCPNCHWEFDNLPR